MEVVVQGQQNKQTLSGGGKMDASWSTSCVVFLLPLLLIILISQRLLFGTKRSQRVKRPPTPPGLPIIGHLHLLRSPAHRSLTRLSARYGPDLLLRFGSRPVLLVSSPSIVEECFTTHDVPFSNRPNSLFTKHFNYNSTAMLAAPYGNHWRNLRRIAAVQLLSSAGLSALLPVRSAEVHSLLRNIFSLSSSDQMDGFRLVTIRSSISELMLNMLMEMMLRKKYYRESATKAQRFSFLVHELFHLGAPANLEDFLPFLQWVGVSGHEKKMVRLQKELDGFLQEMVDDRRSGLTEDVPEGNDASKSLVDHMLCMQKEDPQGYRDDIIKGMMEALIVGGTDTSNITTEWTMSLLLNHPQALKKVQDEIETHVGHQRLVTDADLPNLGYLKNVIKESLRLYPPGPLLVPRELTSDCKVGGFDISRGTMLMVNAYKMHRDPNLWTHSTEFMPERFENGEGEGEGYKYIPFGAGRRRCPGQVLASKVVPLILASLIQCFEWKRVGEDEVDLSEGEGLTMPKAIPLQAICKPREAMVNVLSHL